MQPLTDAEVVASSLSQPEAFGVLFERHFDRVHAYLCARVGADAARELAAETFEQAFRSRHRYDVFRPEARPWLFGIATNMLRHHRRSERRRLHALAASPPALDRGTDVDGLLDRVVASERRAEVAAALRSLRAEERDVLLLHAWADLPYEEIALALGVPVGTVRSRLSRARARLRELLERPGQEGNVDRDTPKEARGWTS